MIGPNILELEVPASFLLPLFSYCYNNLYDSYIQFQNGEGALDASSDRKSAVQQVDRDAMVEEPERQCDGIRCWPARIGSSGVSGRSIFKFRARLWTGSILDVAKKTTQLQIGRSNSVDLFFVLFSNKNMVARCITASARTWWNRRHRSCWS